METIWDCAASASSMAHEMGLRFDQMVCIATPVKLERPKYSVKSLAERVGNALVIFEDAGSDG